MNSKSTIKDNLEDMKENIKATETIKQKVQQGAETVKRPIVGAVKARKPGVFGFVLAFGALAGGYYYWNYMRKPAVDNFLKPSAETRKDAQNLMVASNKLASDLKK